MDNLTVEEKAEALTGVLQHFGKLIQHAQDDNNKMVGAVTLTFHEGGQSNIGYVGSLEKSATMGGLLEALLSFREMVDSRKLQEEMVGLFESMTIPDEYKN